LRMGKEILTTGKVHVWRGAGTDSPNDSEELRSIRQGAWTYDRLVEWADKENEELEVLYRDRNYIVPKQPDRNAVDELCVKLVESVLSSDV